MKFLVSAVKELFSLFVGDTSHTLAMLVWLALMAVIDRLLRAPPRWLGLVLFAGLSVILIENVLRAAARVRK